MPKINYVVPAWGGYRRGDKDFCLHIKKNIDQLLILPHNLTQVTVCVADNPTEPSEFTDYINSLKTLPLPIKILRRPNIGLAYGNYSDTYEQEGNNFDYYIFIEDDYFFVQPHFDTILVDMFEAQENCSYVCGFISRIPQKQWMGNTNGITSSKMLQKVKDKFGKLPYDPKCVGNIYTLESGQVTFSDAFNDIGVLRDITDQYLILHYYWQRGTVEPIPGQSDHSKPCLFLPSQAR